jgi:protein required for attachment to host cells
LVRRRSIADALQWAARNAYDEHMRIRACSPSGDTMQFSKGTTVAVSDGQKLRLFLNKGDELKLALEELPAAELHPHNKGSGKHHHSSGGNPDDRRLEEDSFVSATADLLNQRVQSGAISQLYVVADPRTLGELRRHYSPALQKVLLGELGKEHTGDTVEVIQHALVRA